MFKIRPWHQRKIDWAHGRALRNYCITDGEYHVWDYDRGRAFNPKLNHRAYPNYSTPFGDIQVCTRGCGAERLVNEPSR